MSTRQEAITAANDQVPFFRIPIELRLIIYEYAVAVPKAIRPKQVANGSNKFVWGSHEDNLHRGAYPNEAVLTSTEESQLSVVNLARVSKRIYDELKSYPVFYRINSFHFDHVQDLHVYLSAITPKRRQAMRYIGLSLHIPESGRLNDIWKAYFQEWVSRMYVAVLPNCRPDFHPEPYVLSLLSKCTGIKQFSICLSARTGQSRVDQLGFETAWTDSVWDLPFVQVQTQLSNGEYFTFGESATVPDSVLKTIWDEDLDDNELADQTYADHILQTQRLNAARFNRRKLTEGKKIPLPQWFTNLGNQELLEEAIGAAGIDFPGEIRVSRDRLQSTIGPIASRTRKRGYTLDTRMGAFRYDLPKHNIDGSAIIWNYEIRGIRWTKSGEIECQLKYDEPSRPLVASWENVEKIMFSAQGELTLCKWFDDVFWDAAVTDGRTRGPALERLKAYPSPKDVLKLVVGKLRKFLYGVYEDYGISQWYFERRVDEWLRVESKWDMYVTNLDPNVRL
ncbi:hypothetical protein ABKA04_003114 [Annulohypoxylon sp. FPYF3050]